MSITVEVKGIDEMIAKLQRVGDNVPVAVGEAMYLEGERIMAESKEEYVPVVTGALRSSGYVNPPVVTDKTVVVVLGYGGPAVAYARAVHENPRAGKTGGISPSGQRYARWSRVGQWKYLQRPLELAVRGLSQRIGRTINERIAALTR
jgi:hypothetical protein